MLPLKGPQTQLYRSKCVGVHMDKKTSMVTITAYDGEDVDAGCAITGIMQSTDALIANGRPLPHLHDTIHLQFPGQNYLSILNHVAIVPIKIR